MGSLNFPIIPYRKRPLPNDISQAEDPVSAELFRRMAAGTSTPAPELEFEPMANAATPVVANTGMFSPVVTTPAPIRGRGMFSQDAEYRGEQPPSGLLPTPTPELSFDPLKVEMASPTATAALRRTGLPSETLEVSDANLSEIPLKRINVNQDAIDAGLGSADPRAFRAAQQMRTDFEESKPRNLLQKIGHHFAGAGRGVLEGLSVGGAGGGLVGAILGGINPRLATNLSNRRELAERLPENVQAEELRRRQQQQELQRQQQIAIENDRQERRDLARQAQINLEAERAQNNREQEATAREKEKTEGYKRSKDAADQRGDLSKQGGEFAATPSQLLFGKRVGNRGNIVPSLDGKGFYRLPSQQQEQERKLALERAKGEADLQIALKKDALTAPGELNKYEAKKEIDARYDPPKESPEAKEEKARVKEAKNAHTKIQTLINRAAKQFEEVKGITDPEKAAAKKAAAQGDMDSADREIEIAKQLYPDLIEGGLGDGDFPYVKFKEPKGTGGTTSISPSKGTLSKQAGNYKAGDVVRYKGQRHRILRFENGQPVLDPNPIQ